MFQSNFFGASHFAPGYFGRVAGVILVVKARMVGMMTNLGQLGRGTEKLQ